MAIKETLEYIHNVKWQGSKPGLSRTRELLRALGNPEKQLKFVHVAGTNGKGSTCALIASVLRKAGYKTGLYTSPYIICFNERMQINGDAISDDDLIKMTEEIRPYADAMEDPPTEFEMITALAMKYFACNKCDIVVLEVGMGGQLDSTNVIDSPELAVITAIDYDHVEQLGPALTDIAAAKAGIIKNGCDVLIYGGSNDAESVLAGTAEQQNAVLHKADFSRIKKADISPAGTKMIISPYPCISLPLAGSYQPYNALVAVTALELLRDKGWRIADDDIIKGIAAVKWPGRFEVLGNNPAFVLDGAHNPHGVKGAVESLHACFGDKKVIFIMGVLADKDVTAMTNTIAPAAGFVYAVAPDNPRKLDATALAEMFGTLNIPAKACSSIYEGVKLALERAGRNDGSDIICALGSLFMSADIKTAFEQCKAGKGVHHGI